MLTTEQRRRIIQAMQETQTLLAREMTYSPDLRKIDQVDFYNRHIANLTAMLETNTFIPAA